MLQLYYAVKPFGINNKNVFGANAADYAKFGWKGHNGIDFFAPHATPLYAPCDGNAKYVTDAHGGDGIYIQTPLGSYNIILWHLCSKDDPQYRPLIPLDGSSVSVHTGQLIGYTDNTGAPFESSGDHLHFGLQECGANGDALHPNNGYGGCIDPMPFFTGKYAQDVPLQSQIVQISSQLISLVNESDIPNPQKLDILQKVENFLENLLKQ